MTRIKFAFSPSITNESYHIRHGCRRRYNRGPARGGRVHVCMIQGHKLPYTLPICEEKRGTQPSQAQVIAPLPRERRPPSHNTIFPLSRRRRCCCLRTPQPLTRQGGISHTRGLSLERAEEALCLRQQKDRARAILPTPSPLPCGGSVPSSQGKSPVYCPRD